MKILKKEIVLSELTQLKEYLLNPGTEKAKDYLVFPLFKKLFGSKFKKESDAIGNDHFYVHQTQLIEVSSPNVHRQGCIFKV